MVLLSGDAGIGRRAFCDAVGVAAREAGEKAAVWHLDLDGFEPDTPFALGRFLEYLIDEEERSARDRRRQASDSLKSAAKSLTGSDWLATALSLIWKFEKPLQGFVEMLSEQATGRRGTARPGRVRPDAARPDSEFLRRLLDELTRDRLLLIHVPDLTQVRETYRDWLLAQANRNSRLLLAVSCAAATPTEEVFATDPSSRIRRYELEPPASDELRGELSEKLYAPLREWIEGLPRLQGAMRDFLLLAALCGRNVPCELLLEHLNLHDEAAADLRDLIDDHLVDELEVFADLEFRHPSFPGLNVYRFTHPLLPKVIVDQWSEDDVRMRAESMLRFLGRHLAIRTRGEARRLDVAQYLSAENRKPFERRLSWWIGPDEAEDLSRGIAQSLADGEVDPEMVWNLVLGSDGSWPAYRRLAVLEAYAPAVAGEDGPAQALSPERLQALHYLRAGIFVELGRYQEAMEDASKLLETATAGTLEAAAALNLTGVIRLEQGKPEAEVFEKALEIFRAEMGGNHPNTLNVMANLALTHNHAGEYAAARELLEQVVEGFRQGF
ncbi:MAG: tetratricopeptide repeat protein, partial [Thermoanaerobaculia bacterium]